jgi:hypothetical protein
MRAFAAQAPKHQKAASKHGNVEGAEADEQGQLLVGRAEVAARRQAAWSCHLPPGGGGQRDRPVEVSAHQGQPVGGPQKQGVQSKVRPD